jgi:signal transduction histidine kinase
MIKKYGKWLLHISEIILGTVFIGLAITALVYTLCTKSEIKTGDKSAESALEFLKLQCISYDDLISSEDTVTQMQLLDKANEIKRSLSENPDNTSFLAEFAKVQRLSGIIVIDSSFKRLAEVYTDDKHYEDWAEILKDESIADIFKYPNKTYISHLNCKDNGVYNYVAISGASADEIIFCYSHQTDNVIREKQARIRSLLAGYNLEMDGIIFITDGDTILSANKVEHVGKAYEDYPLLGDNVGNISADKITVVEENGVKYLARYSRCKGYYLYVFLPAKAVFGQRSATIAYVLIVYVLLLLILSVIKQLEISRTNRIKMEFLHQMSHDIRTPINGIRGMVRIGNRYHEDINKQKECRDKIWEASGLLLDLVNDVLDMGKLESGEMMIIEKPFNLHEMLENVADVMDSQAKSQGIRFIKGSLEGEHQNLIGSAVYVRRILINIISNAIKYNKEDGTVTLSCHEINNTGDINTAVYEFICTDTGIGMSKEFQKRMFEQFTQEKSVGEVSHHGTGLGLAIVKSLLREMKGSIRCDSEVDKGTTFYIRIPFTIDTNANTEKLETEEFSDKDLKGITVLLVEDNDINMEVAEFILKEERASVIRAWNGQEAVDIFKQSGIGEIDAILMDIMMPVMDGETAARTIRQLDRRDANEVPIIAMTANAFDEDIQSTYKAGMNAHLAKPVAPEQIKSVILHHLHSKE